MSVDVLKAIDHFSQLNSTQLKQLIQGSEVRDYAAEELILSPERSPDFYSFLI